MAVKTSFPKSVILICKMLLKVNYFAAGKGKSFNCKVIEAEMSLLWMYAKFHIIYFQMISYEVKVL